MPEDVDIIGAALASPFALIHYRRERFNKAGKLKILDAYTIHAKDAPPWTGAHYKTAGAAKSFWTYATLRAMNNR